MLMNMSPEFGRLKEPEEPVKERCMCLYDFAMSKEEKGFYKHTHMYMHMHILQLQLDTRHKAKKCKQLQ